MKKNLLFLVGVLACITAFSQHRKYNFQQPKMGSLFNLVIYSNDSVAAARAAAHAYRQIDTLNQIYSDYLPQSELNRLCAEAGNGKWINVSEPLFQILEAAFRAGKATNGRFDITAGPLTRLWRRARADKVLPGEDSIAAARHKVGYRFIELDTVKKTTRLKKAGMQLDLGGIAKGETAQRVCDRLRALGFPYVLLDAGGDIVAGAVPPGIAGWRVAINLPESEDLMDYRLLLTNNAVTTSGDLYQYLEINGKRYSHVIDPVSGYALTNSRNVTVISGKGINADWLTKACSIMPVRKCMLLVKKFSSTEVQVAVLKAGKPVFYRSRGFKSYLAKQLRENNEKN